MKPVHSSVPDTFPLRVLDSRGSEIRRGTAWFARPDRVVTAFHVVGVGGRWYSEQPGCTCEILLDEWIPLRPCWRHETLDLAMLEPQGDPRWEAPCLKLATRVPEHGEPWLAVGFPDSENGRSEPLCGKVVLHDTTRELLFLTVDQGTDVDWGGVSGAPVRVDSQVVGVLIQDKPGANEARAAPISALLQGLDHDPRALDTWREHLCACCESLPRVLEQLGAPGNLREVLVEVRVSRSAPGDRDPEHLYGRFERLRRPGGRSEEPFRLMSVLAEGHRRWLLVGDPGGGKTTLLRELALDLLPMEHYLPVLLKVADLVNEGSLERAIESDCPGVMPTLARALGEGRALILLDGFDEVVDKKQAWKAIQQVVREHKKCPLILASRQGPHLELVDSRFTELGVCPLGESEQALLLQRFGGDPERTRHALQTLRAHPRLRRLAENPLLLTLVGVVLTRGDLPASRAALYRRAVRTLLERKLDTPREGERRLEESQVELAERLLPIIALEMHERGMDVMPLTEMSKLLRRDPGLLEEIRAAGWPEPERFIEDMREDLAGMLVKDTSRKGVASGYHFPHRTFEEYFAACRVAEDFGGHATGGNILSRLMPYATASPSQWTEVLALCCGLLEDPGDVERLIRRIIDRGDVNLVRQVVAEAEGLAPETVFEVIGLVKGGENWEARRKVIEELHVSTGRLDVALGLAWKVIESSRNGNDLFFAREYLRAIARGEVQGDPGERDLVELRRDAGERAFRAIERHRALHAGDHEEAMRILEGQLVRIQAGTFDMGSPEDEAGRYDDEGPVHTVTLTRPFEMQRVPVTHALYECFDPGHREDRPRFEGLDPSALDEHPCINVTFYQALIFAEWIDGSLPTEAEWEYACRASSQSPYYNGHDEGALRRAGWYAGNAKRQTRTVGQKEPNQWGLYDMHGNVWEWCLDAWRNNYKADSPSVIDPCHPGEKVGPHLVNNDWRVVSSSSHSVNQGASKTALNASHVVRGGSWYNEARRLRSAGRGGEDPWVCGFLGFRVVRRVLREHG